MPISEADYPCTSIGCGRVVGKKNLTAKKVFFGDVGQDSGVFRVRTVGWLCPTCLEKDPDYNYPPRVSVKARVEYAAQQRGE